MTQRNPMNERYQNNGEKTTGKTRKSAASAKPVTKAASSVRIVEPSSNKGRRGKGAASGKKGSKQDKQAKQTRTAVNLTEEEMVEYRKWSRVRNILFGVAIVLTLVGPVLFLNQGNVTNLYYVMLVLGYAAIIAAIVVDLRKVQKLRHKNAPGARIDDRSKEATRARKAGRAAGKQRAKQEEAEEELAEAIKAERKSRRRFGKKKDADKDASKEKED